MASRRARETRRKLAANWPMLETTCTCCTTKRTRAPSPKRTPTPRRPEPDPEKLRITPTDAAMTPADSADGEAPVPSGQASGDQPRAKHEHDDEARELGRDYVRWRETKLFPMLARIEQ